MADFHKELQILDCDMPLDFKHENAFKFGSIDYGDARWVTVSDMFQIRGVENVALYRTTLTSNNVRHFISHWINCRDDMFEWMRITAMEIIQLEGGLFNELVVLEHHFNPPNIVYFTLAKSTSRVFKLLEIYHEVNSVILSASESYDEHRNGNEEEMLKNVYEILELLEKKKTLEKEFEETRNVAKRRGYRDQIQKLERRIHELGVVYRDGRATI
ncbi:hypothetical protein CRE_28889 [Caenorhabditis remanei]|uniref:Uncharacterized protein n=1 Tax=Caenorhabditis remanei TaxID=31234 RepID=E3MXD3_CAERE|nr:hypothetical protein CRE_28889 [Caenorhabditis remanei]